MANYCGSSIYNTIAEKLVEMAKGGKLPWLRSWKQTMGARSYVTGKPYSLLNQFLLNNECGEYITLKQCNKLGGRVKKGAKGHYITFWSFIDKKDEPGKRFPLLKGYTVFNIKDCEGIEPHEEEVLLPNNPIEEAEKLMHEYLTAYGIGLENSGSDSAYYDIRADKVVLPNIGQFKSSNEYYGVAFHEMTHSTGAESRLKRKGIIEFDRFGSDQYSEEELIAEMGSAFIANRLGLDTEEMFTNNAAYIQGWSKKIMSDPKLFVHCASKAEKAVKLIFGEISVEEEKKDAA